MKRRILSVICAWMLVMASISCMLTVSAAIPTELTDPLDNLNLVTKTDGDWYVWNPHGEVGRSLAARNSTETENNLFYSFSDRHIDSLTVTVAELTGFFSVAQVPVFARADGAESWTAVVMSASEEQEIPEATNASFKQIVLTAQALPENTCELKIGLANDPTYTVMIDSVHMTFCEKSDLLVFSDPLDSLALTAQSTSNLQCFSPHSEVGHSLVGRVDASSDSYLYYRFPNQTIASLVLDTVVLSGYYPESELPTAEALVDGSDEWQPIRLSFGAETEIEGATNAAFQARQATGSLPSDAVTLRLRLNNTINYTVFLDTVTLNLAEYSKPTDSDYFTDELLSLTNTSSYDGEWDIFNHHSEFGLSVLGRTDIASENNLYYTVSGSTVKNVTVKAAQHRDFPTANTDVKIYVRTDDAAAWTELNKTLEAPQDITGYEASSYQSVTLQASVPVPGIRQVKIALANAVSWTLFLDSVTLQLEKELPSVVGDVTGDGLVNIVDLIHLKKAIAAQDLLGAESDLNGDFQTDILDLALLQKHLMGVFPLEKAEVLAMRREAVTLSNFATTERAWLASTQLESGAIPVRVQSAEGDAVINPYFADYSAMALLEAPELYAANVVNYIHWHFEHLNADGTIYDYAVSGGTESHAAQYDSTDSYAATFLSLLNQFYITTGQTDLILAHKSDIERVVSAMLSTYDNGLTFAKSEYKIKYMMDNCEVLAGLRDAANLYERVIEPADESFAGKGAYLAALADSTQNAIETQLWNPDGYYEIGLDESGNVPFSFSWQEHYPSAMAQLFPIFTGTVTADSERAKSLYDSYMANHTVTDLSATTSYYSMAARTAAVMGDRELLKKYISAYSAMAENTEFRYTPYTAHVVMAAETMRQNILQQIG